MDDCIGFRGSKTLKKNYCEISPQKIHFMRNKQSGNLNREKSRILPGGKLSYSFFSGQNLLENVIKHCLPVFSRFPPMKCSRLTLLFFLVCFILIICWWPSSSCFRFAFVCSILPSCYWCMIRSDSCASEFTFSHPPIT